jgi:hypothetical protein
MMQRPRRPAGGGFEYPAGDGRTDCGFVRRSWIRESVPPRDASLDGLIDVDQTIRAPVTGAS